jgi:hypothetical protein
MPRLVTRSQLAEVLHSHEELRAALHLAESREQYNALHRRANTLSRRGRWRSDEETKLLRLFKLLIQDYDHRHPARPDASTPGSASA